MKAKYCVTFALLGSLLLFVAVGLRSYALLLAWPAVDCFWLAFAYGRMGAGLWGKSKEGKHSWVSAIILLPYLLKLWAHWHLLRLRSRDNPCDLVVPGSGSLGNVWVGRWPYANQVPREVMVIVDLAAEFSVRPGVRDGRDYRSYPILDGVEPGDEQSFLAQVGKIAEGHQNTLVYCANGHERSALFAAAVLLARGQAASPDEAVNLAKSRRPGIDLKKSQKAFVDRAAGKLMPVRPNAP